MKYVFYQVDECKQILETVLDSEESGNGEQAEFYDSLDHLRPLNGWESPDRAAKLTIFYQIWDRQGLENIRCFLHINRMQGHVVALCRDYKEGIRAMENGSDYALLLPLKEDKIIHCYQFLDARRSENERKNY